MNNNYGDCPMDKIIEVEETPTSVVTAGSTARMLWLKIKSALSELQDKLFGIMRENTDELNQSIGNAKDRLSNDMQDISLIRDVTLTGLTAYNNVSVIGDSTTNTVRYVFSKFDMQSPRMGEDPVLCAVWTKEGDNTNELFTPVADTFSDNIRFFMKGGIRPALTKKVEVEFERFARPSDIPTDYAKESSVQTTIREVVFVGHSVVELSSKVLKKTDVLDAVEDVIGHIGSMPDDDKLYGEIGHDSKMSIHLKLDAILDKLNTGVRGVVKVMIDSRPLLLYSDMKYSEQGYPKLYGKNHYSALEKPETDRRESGLPKEGDTLFTEYTQDEIKERFFMFGTNNYSRITFPNISNDEFARICGKPIVAESKLHTHSTDQKMFVVAIPESATIVTEYFINEMGTQIIDDELYAEPKAIVTYNDVRYKLYGFFDNRISEQRTYYINIKF